MREKRWGRIIGIQSSSVKEPVEYIDLFLASEQAAYITGAVYQVDGGKTRSNL